MFNIPFLHKRSFADEYIAIGGKNIKLIVGLGNPGQKYDNTYHNVGFMFIDYLVNNAPGSESGGLQKWKSTKSFRYVKLGGLILAKPNEFMNNSGGSIKNLLKYFKLKPEELLVVHDDSDIALGGYKISFGRGSAGHNGVESAIKSLKTHNFSRLRVGTNYKSQRADKFVLKKLKDAHRENLELLFSKIKADYFEV